MTIKVFKRLKNKNIVKLTFDDETIKAYQEYVWTVENSRGHLYLRRRIWEGKKSYRIHFSREVMNLTARNLVVDHKNGDSLDNRSINLRITTQELNMRNMRRSSKYRKSKYQGVSWNKNNNNWRVTIRVMRKAYEIGSFKTEEEAALAYNKACIKYKGEYAVLNDIGIGETK